MENYSDSVRTIIENKLPENEVSKKLGKVLQTATTLSTIYNQGMNIVNKGKKVITAGKKATDAIKDTVDNVKKALPEEGIENTAEEGIESTAEQGISEASSTIDEIGSSLADLPTEPTMMSPFSFPGVSENLSAEESLLAKLNVSRSIPQLSQAEMDALPDLDQLAPMRAQMAQSQDLAESQQRMMDFDPENDITDVGENTAENTAGNVAENAGEDLAENAGEDLAENEGESIGSKIAGQVGKKSATALLGELDADSTSLDETPIGWLVTAGLSLATLFSSLGDLGHHVKTQAGLQVGI